MAAINFPTATADGQTFEADNGVVYTYVGTPPNGYWSGTFQNESYTTLDARYLKLDSSNDPVTASLEVNNNVTISRNSTAPGIVLNNSNYSGDDASIYYFDTGAVVFKSNNTEIFRYDANGNVGIGSNNPSERLVLADVAAPSGFSDTAISMVRSNYGGRIAGYIDQGVGHGITIDTIDSSTPTERLRITGDGKVGVGTETPLGNLEVKGSGFVSSHISSDNTNEAQLRFETNTAARVSNQSDAALIFETNATERARIKNDGKVGIGTTSPGQKFVVSDGGAQGLEFNPFTSDRFILAGYNRSTSQYIQLEYEGSNHLFKSGTSEKMRIDSSGNVGVGTSDPKNKLTVRDGDIALVDGANVPEAGRSIRFFGAGLQAATGGYAAIKGALNSYTPGQTQLGNLVFYTSGSERLRIQPFGGISFNGDTAAANALDDYEEGLWTPAFTGGTFTYTKQVGKYTKIGDLVYLSAYIAWSAKSGNSNLSSAIPFTTAGSQTDDRYPGSIGYCDGIDNGGERQLVTSISGNRSGVGFYLLRDNGTPNSTTVQNANDTGEIQFSFVIKVK